ncbi:hypothetical protein [Ancylomarina longa]|uniref:Uncharacterized protein n=1 Tax=Ancylomarina longa TaxID=2487017 RepID=A0A434AXM4_9BACT|nr:hypothetical protein [Ancylomarina longa]RUT79187.1 hypothetical protein DLK05_05050 [Ancylomarina longa]
MTFIPCRWVYFDDNNYLYFGKVDPKRVGKVELVKSKEDGNHPILFYLFTLNLKNGNRFASSTPPVLKGSNKSGISIHSKYA